MTILDARVSEENWPALEQAYKEAAQDDQPSLVQSYLVHNSQESELWRIITIWRSWEDLAKMRSSGGTPRGILIFRSAHAEPALSVFEIAQQISKNDL